MKTIDKITGINISYYISKTNYKDSPFSAYKLVDYIGGGSKQNGIGIFKTKEDAEREVKRHILEDVRDPKRSISDAKYFDNINIDKKIYYKL